MIDGHELAGVKDTKWRPNNWRNPYEDKVDEWVYYERGADAMLDALMEGIEPELAIVDRGAKVPQRQKLADGNLLLEAQDKNGIYLNGQIVAQENMLKAGWVKLIDN